MTAVPPVDPSLSGLPTGNGVAQLRQLIERVAAGELPLDDLIGSFRAVYEGVEQAGRPQYRSKDEARLIWDVLWALEFYSPDPSRESDPTEWNDAAAVMAVVHDAARRLKAV